MRLADEAYALGAAETADTYLNIDAMASAAVRAHADAVHPGHGFLAENADFAQAVIDAGMVWVGPKPETIRVLGSKVAARRIAAEVVEFAREHGLPIAIKAVYGGGGRGLKVVHEPDEVAAAFESAMHEAEVAFGNGDCFVERFLARLWHVEVQVLGDQFGTVLAVGTRDCSLQRRNQKLIEEAPAPFLAAETVRELERAAVAICSRAHYESAGTVGFLVDDGTMSFMEVNTHIQVEHPVTEAVTGVDLVAAQLAIAEGAPVEAVPGLESGVTPEPRGGACDGIPHQRRRPLTRLRAVPRRRRKPAGAHRPRHPLRFGRRGRRLHLKPLRFDDRRAHRQGLHARRMPAQSRTRARRTAHSRRAHCGALRQGGARISGFRRGCRLEGRRRCVQCEFPRVHALDRGGTAAESALGNA
ncbi:hypothetical protein BIFLAC_00344 [Bifidobacterium animalis subsp. lactis HN019]|nr:biotin carboxylase/biotin carboxyl carrier protein [Bifidobacterium animalis subsp. lactis DSM 10140]EDT89123.1 hypothetical protein BIFLAC_00344 [Bifidobacterium animalis subsp. lactis HN019]QIR80168.1 hypothetical protein M8PIadj_0141 [Bifidobacterium animalis]